MKVLKRRLFRIFFAMEMVAFACIYVLGPHGMRALRKVHQEHDLLLADIATLQNEVNALGVQIAQWHAHPFYKEKIAREQLQMARKGDQIYYLS